jgi:hypothetical protein
MISTTGTYVRIIGNNSYGKTLKNVTPTLAMHILVCPWKLRIKYVWHHS